ncbi:PREDICTED: acidic mammalian chitinase-like [Priapulus caudatus]|uniref:Acidic mammalian chitinase-like n=1 Tax=Priapulus caudatus TaxID=37621 RepID=A0ABM1ETD2_PRICU|nr:PREDICTED: acidic mammalian chitinase-like [Priapulus caudatus]
MASGIKGRCKPTQDSVQGAFFRNPQAPTEKTDMVNDLKKKNPHLKVLIAVGGYSLGSYPFSIMVANANTRALFVKQSIDFLRQHGFDGLDIDWEYPSGIDKERFVYLVKALKEAYEQEAMESQRPRLLLTAAVPAGGGAIDNGFDIRALSSYLDFISLMSYDLHGQWESFLGHNSPLFARSNEDVWQKQLNIKWAADKWVDGGCPKEKLIIGLAAYGRSFTLQNPSMHVIGDPAKSGGTAGKYTGEYGYMAYYEVCIMLNSGGTRVWNDEHKVPYAYKGDQWVGYDDEESIANKVAWIKSQGFGGAMTWSLDLDDFRGAFCNKGKYPLLNTMKNGLPSSYELDGWVPPSTVTTSTSAGSVSTTPSGEGGSVENFCHGKRNGYYADDADCTMFYQCFSDVTHHLSCTPGLRWSRMYTYCDWADNVECVESQGDNIDTL